MTINWMRRAFVAAACASAALLSACGSSVADSAIAPSRFVTFGDGFTDVGQTGARYTVNDGTQNIWAAQLASLYNLTITPASQGGLGYAQGNARISATPDAAGNTATPTISAQIDSFLASKTFAANDVVLMSGGLSDLIVGMRAVQAGAQTGEQFVASARLLGQTQAAQVRRLVTAGAPHVVVAGVYWLGQTPWGIGTGQVDMLNNASKAFNEAMLAALNDLAKNVFYVDAAYYVNLYTTTPSSYGFGNFNTAVCTSVDAGAGIGIGAGEVNSALCTASTLVAGANKDQYVFADKVYLSASAQRQFGTYAYDRLRARW